MYARLFSIEAPPSGDDAGGILVWGIDFADEAVTYRRDPDTRRTNFGVHQSAESALSLQRRLYPEYDLTLVWEDDWDEAFEDSEDALTGRRRVGDRPESTLSEAADRAT
jgi:hypothetical protein